MRLAHRIGRLESRKARAAPQRCASCSVPEGWSPIFDVVGDDGRSALDACGACGFALDAGRPVFALPPGRGEKHFGPDVDWRAV